MTLQLYDVLMLLTMLQLAIFAVVLVFSRTGKTLAGKLLGFFFLSLALNMAGVFLYQHHHDLPAVVYHFLYLGIPFAFAYAPLFYLYAGAVIGNDYRFTRVRWLNFIPTLILLIYILAGYTFRPLAEKQEIVNTSGLGIYSRRFELTVLVQIQVMFYFLLFAFNLSVRRKKHHREGISREPSFQGWLLTIVAAVAFLWLIDLYRFFADRMIRNPRFHPEIILYGGFMVFCYYFLYRALAAGGIDLIAGLKTLGRGVSSLSATRKEQYTAQLKEVMEKKNLYLNPDLNLELLSRESGIPRRSLSEVIKSCMEQNFNDFVNTYRIREAKKMLSDPECSGKTILEILYACGFNSKSVFNQVFKKSTGLTPTQFRKVFNKS